MVLGQITHYSILGCVHGSMYRRVHLCCVLRAAGCTNMELPFTESGVLSILDPHRGFDIFFLPNKGIDMSDPESILPE